MILERERGNQQKRQKQQQYRQQLYNTAQQQKMLKNRSRVAEFEPPKQTFSLIKHIQNQQDRRKKQQQQYYVELQKQRQQELMLKKKRIQEEKRKQQQMDQKIQKENQMLMKRYQQERKKQQNKKNMVNQRAQQMHEQYAKKQQYKTQRKGKTQINQTHQEYPQDSLDQMRGQIMGNEQLMMSRQLSQMPVTFAYPTRVENQQFNFPMAKSLSNNHYRQLQIQKIKLADQANSLVQLNRYLGAQRTYPIKRTEGLESLKQVTKMLDDQTTSIKQQYWASKQNFNGSRSNNYSRINSDAYYYF